MHIIREGCVKKTLLERFTQYTLMILASVTTFSFDSSPVAIHVLFTNLSSYFQVSTVLLENYPDCSEELIGYLAEELRGYVFSFGSRLLV